MNPATPTSRSQTTPIAAEPTQAAAGLRVVAPSRLHFGLLGFEGSAYPFGGVGVVIDHPAAIVEITPAEAVCFTGPAEQRAKAAAKSWSRTTANPLPGIRVRVSHLIGQHVGLGSGTQLAMAVAKALFEFHGITDVTPPQLAASAGRGGRSSVGTLGFCLGGLIAERGHTEASGAASIASSYKRIPIPDTWRFVICRPETAALGLSGSVEQSAFDRLPPIPDCVTHRLVELIEKAMLPALEDAKIDAFGEAVYEFGTLAGSCFAAVQGGPFANAETAEIVQSIREFGVRGAGQSSWGPTVFAMTKDESEATALCRALQNALGFKVTTEVAAASNNGAIVSACN